MKKTRALFPVVLSLCCLALFCGCQKAEEKAAKPAPAPGPPPVVSSEATSSIAPTIATSVPVPPTPKAGENKPRPLAAGPAEPGGKAKTEKPPAPAQPKLTTIREAETTGQAGPERTEVAKAAPAVSPPAPELKLLPAAPHFELEDTRKNRVSLEDYRGKTVLLLFTAVWCPPCRQILPELMGLAEKYRDKGFVVLTIFTADTEAANVDKYVAQSGIAFPALMDDRVASKKYGIAVLPTFVLIDKKGRITKRAQFGATKNVIADVSESLALALD